MNRQLADISFLNATDKMFIAMNHLILILIKHTCIYCVETIRAKQQQIIFHRRSNNMWNHKLIQNISIISFNEAIFLLEKVKNISIKYQDL